MTDEQPNQPHVPPRAWAPPAAQPPTWPPIPPTPSPPARTGPPTAALIVLLGGALTVISAFLVWLTITEPTGTWQIHGMDDGRDGVVALLLGAATLAAGLAALPATAGRLARRAPIALGLLAIITAVANLADTEQRARNAALWSTDYQWTLMETGPGLYVLLVGGIVTTLAGCAPRICGGSSTSSPVRG